MTTQAQDDALIAALKTWVLAEVPAGATGAPGATGTQGATGPIGATGATGATGPAGTSSNTTISDAAGVAWGFGTPVVGDNTPILRNGTAHGLAVELALAGGVMYAKSFGGSWYEDTNGTWSAPTTQPFQPTATLVPGGTVVTTSFKEPPPPTPLPAVVAGVYYVRRNPTGYTGPLPTGDDLADGQRAPWATVARAMQAPAGSTVLFWGGGTFVMDVGTTLTLNAGSKIDAFGAGQATIQANYCAAGAAGPVAIVINGAATVGAGITLLGDGGHTVIGAQLQGVGPAFHGQVGGFFNGALDSPTGGVGIDVYFDACTNPNITGALIGGTEPSSPDQNGILSNTSTGKVSGFTVQFIGGHPISPAQTGFGIHTNQSYNGPNNTVVPLEFINGEPTNYSLWFDDFTIHDIAWNITDSKGGGPSGAEAGTGGGVCFTNFKIFNVGPNPATFRGGVDFTPLDLGDAGARFTFAGRGVVWNCYGGLEDFNGGSVWGPSVGRYILSINCGYGTTGSCIIQDNGGGGTHQYYNCTFVVVSDGGTYGSNQNLRLFEMQNAKGLLANCIFYTISPNYYAALVDALPSADFTITNNAFFGVGAGFNLPGGTVGSLPPLLATNALVSDPQFVGTAGSLVPSDYALKPGSPYKKAGLDLTTLGIDVGSTDLFGNPVRSGAPDIGCGAFAP